MQISIFSRFSRCTRAIVHSCPAFKRPVQPDERERQFRMAWQDMKRGMIYLSAMGCAASGAHSMANEAIRLHAVAVPRPEIKGAPEPAAVCMRSLRPRPVSEKDPHNTLDAIRGFHVSWLEWTYGNNEEFIRKVHDLGVTYGGALAAGSYSGNVQASEWKAIDLDGNLLVPPALLRQSGEVC